MDDDDESDLRPESPTASEMSASIIHPMPETTTAETRPVGRKWDVEGVCELLDVRKRVDAILARPEVDKQIAIEIQSTMMDMERLIHRERTRAEIAAVEFKLEYSRVISELDRYARRQTLENVQQTRQMEEDLMPSRRSKVGKNH